MSEVRQDQSGTSYIGGPGPQGANTIVQTPDGQTAVFNGTHVITK